MGLAQVVVILMYVAALCVASNQHGKERKGKVSFWITLILVIANFAILAFGGFFDGAFNLAA